MHIFIEPFAIQQPAGAVQAGRVTGEVSGATASTHDSGDSTGASSSLKWKHLDPDPVRGMSEYIPVIQRFECYSWVARDVRHHFLKSKIKEPPKLLSSSGMKGE